MITVSTRLPRCTARREIKERVKKVKDEKKSKKVDAPKGKGAKAPVVKGGAPKGGKQAGAGGKR